MKIRASSQVLRVSKARPSSQTRSVRSSDLQAWYLSLRSQSNTSHSSYRIPYLSQPKRPLATLSEGSPAGLDPPPGGKTSSHPPSPGGPLSDERKVKLGRTVRFLRSRLPTLLASPLPQEILSPQISLHLFPSTHPHLPTVSGRVAYHAALWSAPVAWGRFPIIGNVKLDILDQRMIDEGRRGNYEQQEREKLVIRWRTAGGPTSLAAGTARIAQLLGRSPSSPEKPPPSPFHGLFIFTFDERGRIFTHTIEHSEESKDADTVTSKVFNLTDWLIKKARGQDQRLPELAWSRGKISMMRSGLDVPGPTKRS